MKIGFLIYGSLDTLSGGYLYDYRLVDYLRDQGDDVEIISLPWRNYPTHLTDNFHFRLPLDLDLLIQDELNHPSLLFANSIPRTYPVISLVHHLRCSEQRPDYQNWLYRLVEEWYLKSVDGFIFNSETTKGVVDGLIENGIPNVVASPPTDRFGHPMTEIEVSTRAYESGPLRLLFLGNVIHRKGLHTLLGALKVQSKAFILDVVGGLKADPNYAREMQDWSQISSFKSQVFFHGALDKEDLIEKMKFAHVLVVPSSYEGFGIVYLEGMAFGLPAIGTTAGAASEIISDNKTGFLIEPDDTDMLANRLLKLANDRELLAQISVNALDRYCQQPTWDETARRIREFLQRISKSRLTKQSP